MPRKPPTPQPVLHIIAQQLIIRLYKEGVPVREIAARVGRPCVSHYITRFQKEGRLQKRQHRTSKHEEPEFLRGPLPRRQKDKLRYYRLRVGVSQVQAAELVAVSSKLWSAWENGTRKIDSSHYARVVEALQLERVEAQRLFPQMSFSKIRTVNITTLGGYLRARREELGLTQAAVSQAVGSTENSVSGWENGKRTPRDWKIEQLAAALRTTKETLTDLIYGENARAYQRIKEEAPQPVYWDEPEPIPVAVEHSDQPGIWEWPILTTEQVLRLSAIQVRTRETTLALKAALQKIKAEQEWEKDLRRSRYKLKGNHHA